MKKYAQIAITLLLAVTLSGCAFGEAPTDFAVRQDDGVSAWSAESALERETQQPTEVAEELPDETEMLGEGTSLEVEVDVLGIFPLVETETETGGTELVATLHPTACLEANREYEVWTRVLIWQEPLVGQETTRAVNLGMFCPSRVGAAAKTGLAAAVTPEDGGTVRAEDFTVTTLAYDLAVEYVPDSMTVYQQNRKTPMVLNDAGWGYVPGAEMMQISGAVNLSCQVRATELTVCYRIKTEILSSQLTEVAQRAEEPLRIKYLGFVQTLDTLITADTALAALQEQQREDYLLPEQVQAEGTVYLITEVTIPAWAREFVQEYGLKLAYFCYLDGTSGEYGISVELENFPRDHGYAEKLVELAFEQREYRLVTLDSMPKTPVTLWVEDETGGLSLAAEIKNLTEFSYDATTNREEQSRLLTGGNIAPLVEGGKFYLVTAYEVECH